MLLLRVRPWITIYSKMFIGGLNWDTTDESLRNYFSQFGKVDACTIMRDAAGRSRCFAFLTFEDPASVNAVMVREHFLDGKIIDPKRAIPRQEHQRATKLFIGGLPGSVTSESMRDFFSQFGKVIDSTVMLDRETGRSKGFGFVSFEDTDVTPFLGFGKLEIDGKLIDVKLAQPRYQRDNFNEDTRGSGFNAQSGGSFGAGASTGGSTNVPASMGTGMTAPAAGNTPFDPQALAALYTRMFQLAGGASMMGGMSMNPMMGGMGGGSFGGGFGGAMGGMGRGMGSMGMSGGMGSNMGGGMGGGGGVSGGGMGRGSQGAMQGGPPTGPNGLGPNVPRGPRGAQGGPGGPGGPGVGPQRAAQRGQHSYHPYAR
ncbi:hypothetical protein EV401DRAFT_1509275 [Pisolithus croceorrhizus]|nr:hypothetical protein EV401DRAFT_1509275 [Pisolithus croceorrhizus]